MSAAKIPPEGQITLPKNIREHLKIQQGDKIEFHVESNGTVLMFPVKSDVRTLKGLISLPKETVSLDDMKEAIITGSQRL